MKAKALEIRDRMTFIPALAINLDPLDSTVGAYYLMRRCGYSLVGDPIVILTRLDGTGQASNDPYAWGGRTMPVAHEWIIAHWDALTDGDVVDVEFILGETETKKLSERFTT